MKLQEVNWLSPRRVDIEIAKDDNFVSFCVKREDGTLRIFFENVPHVLYLVDNEWHMIEEEVYES